MTSAKRQTTAELLRELRSLDSELPTALAFGEPARRPSSLSVQVAANLAHPVSSLPVSLNRVKRLALMLDTLRVQAATLPDAKPASRRRHGS